MLSAPRPIETPLPGDLYLDSAVPECERVTMTRNGWTAQVTHVWTGTGWARLVPGTVREVPTATVRPNPRPASSEQVSAWRQRKRASQESAAAAAMVPSPRLVTVGEDDAVPSVG